MADWSNLHPFERETAQKLEADGYTVLKNGDNETKVQIQGYPEPGETLRALNDYLNTYRQRLVFRRSVPLFKKRQSRRGDHHAR